LNQQDTYLVDVSYISKKVERSEDYLAKLLKLVPQGIKLALELFDADRNISD
jgi:hypothetical protein